MLFALAALLGADRAWAAVTSVGFSRSTFSPNGDGVRDSAIVAWTLSGPAQSLSIEVRRGGETDVVPALRTIDLGAWPAGADSAAWDGKNDGGVIQAGGLYTLRVVERASGGAIVSALAASVVLDNTPPGLPRFEPDFDGFDTTDSTLLVGGVAPGADSVVVFVNGVPAETLAIPPADSTFQRAFVLAPGASAFAVRANDRAGNLSALSTSSIVTYRNSADVSEFRALPSRFSPNADGVQDTAHVTFKLDAATSRLELQIRRANPPSGTAFADSVPYVRLYDGPAPAGGYALDWVGLDSLGAPAPEGTYFAFARAESSTVLGGPAAGRPRALRVDLDTTRPAAPVLTVALPAQTTHTTVRLIGTVSGGDSVRVMRGSTRVAQGPANFDLLVAVQLGDNSFYLEGVDLAGNRSPLAGPFHVVYAEAIGFHGPERFRRGDVFEINLATSPREVRIELFTLDGRLLRTLVSTSSNPNAEMAWNLLDDHGHDVGDGPCVARLTVTYPDGHSVVTKAAVVVAK